MKKLIILLCALPSFLFAQNEQTATVLSEVPIGNFSYFILEENISKKLYKTVGLEHNKFAYGEVVEVNDVIGTDLLVPVKDLKNNQVVMAERVNQNNNVNTSGIPNDLYNRLPVEKGGILYFQSQKHLFEVYEMVNVYIESMNDKSEKKMLKNIEKLFPNFTSYNKYFNNKYDFKNKSYNSDQVTKIENEDFINDEILKTFLNSKRVVVIENDLYYWHNRDLVINFSTKLLDKYLSLIYDVSDAETNGGYDVYDPRSIIYRTEEIVYTSSANGKKPKTKNLLILDNIDEYLRYQTIPTSIPLIENCNKFKKGLKLELFEETLVAVTIGSPPTTTYQSDYHVYDLNPNPGTLKINWGDGTPLETINNYVGQVVEHTYASEGEFYPLTILTFEDKNGFTQNIHDGRFAIPSPNNGLIPSDIVMNTTNACTTQDKEQPGSATSGDWRLEAKIWVNHNILGHHIGSHTHAWKKNSSGNWNRKIAAIYTNIYGTFRSEACVVNETKFGSDTENQERVSVTVNKIGRKYKAAGNNSIYSEHSLTKGSTVINLSLTLTPCP